MIAVAPLWRWPSPGDGMMVLKEAEPWILCVLSGTPVLMILVLAVVVGRRD